VSSELLMVKNPHSILAALKSRPNDVLEVWLPREVTDDVWMQIQALCSRHRVKLVEGGAKAASTMPLPAKPHQGRPAKPQGKPAVVFGRESSHGATIKPKASVSIESLLEGVDAETRGVWLALDNLQDPQNLGAIFRAASFFGVRGIIMTTERSAPMTATVYDIAAGGVEDVPFVQIINLQRAFEKAKEAGLWTLGTSEHAKESLWRTKADRPWLVVMGNEEKGLRRLTLESCDVTVGIPPIGNAMGKGVTSLNVSVATGVMLSHLVRPN